jgi:hypothetical protein
MQNTYVIILLAYSPTGIIRYHTYCWQNHLPPVALYHDNLTQHDDVYIEKKINILLYIN